VDTTAWRSDSDLRESITLPAEAPSLAAVRRHLRTAVTVWRLEPLQYTAELLASELTANVVEHSSSREPFEVTLRRAGEYSAPGG
jgi:hypothetical protein